ncbi:helicase-related protein [Variovorax sp. PAMC26660]|uniref:helicase-related protein n=1 Tax=Variovorax sp. PAMC26660 TaxID=2762322 RepID=UPI00164D3E2E|nr:helicase-related protein [Variovorax sp. PAMC26660]QNK68560.1 helicase [Variovorax sp. PAMC26660]
MTHPALAAVDKALASLTDFQRASVEAACERLDGGQSLGRRLLVADEVGLGKTLVARGVIASLLKQRLKAGEVRRPLRVAYICSNQALARENERKLAIFHDKDAERWVSAPNFSRLAELGLRRPAAPSGALIELCTLTPATSFTLTQGGGNARERFILWRAVVSAGVDDTPQLERFFSRDYVGAWSDAGKFFQESKGLEPRSLKEFRRMLGTKPSLDDKTTQAAIDAGLSLRSWRALASAIGRRSGKAHVFSDLSAVVRAGLRHVFVQCCAGNLGADLFILDEFQRFDDLVRIEPQSGHGTQDTVQQSERQLIARRVLHEGDGYATLLLSATPFKALSHLGDEDDQKAHSQQITQLLAYLAERDPDTRQRYEIARQALLQSLLCLPPSPLVPGSLPREPKHDAESALRHYICRTERAGIERGIDEVFVDRRMRASTPSNAEVASFIALDRLAEALKTSSISPGVADVMSFHKAAPWSLSFLSGYQFRDTLRSHCGVPMVKEALKKAGAAWIPAAALNNFQIDLGQDAPSDRFKQVLEVAAPCGAEQLLWLAPSLPNYAADGPFRDKEGFSKTLLFSSLMAAPRALSSLVSYECERRLQPKRGKRPSYFDARESSSRAFRSDENAVSAAWALVYPSAVLGAVRLSPNGGELCALRASIRNRIQTDFDALVAKHGGGTRRHETRWYAMAPMLLDRLKGKTDHFDTWARSIARSKVAVARKTQVARMVEAAKGTEGADLQLGAPPADLLAFLVDLAIAGPGVCLKRAFDVTWPPGSNDSLETRLMRVSDAALAFVDKMNRVESQLVIRAVLPRARPWVAVVQYAAMGNLQAVLDEYMHLLKPANNTMKESVEAFEVAVGTSAVSVTAQSNLPGSERRNHDVRFHCHYAVPLGNQRGTEEAGLNRIAHIRASFNSPFWPFMLNSTSIGQEGLDFHWYCRRVVHWSLPSNPIDLEQREGRVNRFKSLVVRQRVAQVHGPHLGNAADPWSELFRLASAAAQKTDMVPFWYVPGGTARIERVVPSMPFSAEVSRLDEILRILSLYRLSFGQPRQQELIENLLRRNYDAQDLDEIRRALLIDLAPINYRPTSPA